MRRGKPEDVIAHLETKVRDMEEELDRYRNGFQGGCYACETVGENNVKLAERIKELEARIAELEESNKRKRNKIKRMEQSRYNNFVKAEGVREMLLYCMVTKPEVDEHDVPVRLVSIDDIEQYADKLEGK